VSGLTTYPECPICKDLAPYHRFNGLSEVIKSAGESESPGGSIRRATGTQNATKRKKKPPAEFGGTLKPKHNLKIQSCGETGSGIELSGAENH
jgi:hypothetical protein